MSDIDTYTKLMLPMNSDFTDLSAGNHTPTVTGATIDTSIKKMGPGSGKFVSASSQYVSYPNHADWDFGAGLFTLDLWIYYNTISGNQVILSYGDYIAGGGWVFWRASSGNTLYLQYKPSGNPSGTTLISVPWTPSTSTWYHILLSKDSSDDYRIFINGTQIGSTTNNTASLPVSTERLFIGAYRNNGSIQLFLDAEVDEIHISKGIARETANFTPRTREYGVDVAFLNQRYALDTRFAESSLNQRYALAAPALNESTLNQRYTLDAPAGLFKATLNQRYALTAATGIAESTLNQRYIQTGSPLLLPRNTPLTPITTTYTLTLTGPLIYDSALKMLLHLNEDFTDIIDAARIPGVNGASIDRSTTIFAGPCGRFNAAQKQYVDFPDSPDWPAGTNNFTVEFRVRRNRLATVETIWNQGSPDFLLIHSSGLAEFTADNKIDFHITSGTTRYNTFSTTIFDSLTETNHIACVRDGNTLKLYINGTVEDTVNVTGISANDSAYRFTIGRQGEADRSVFDGWIDEFAVWNTARSTFPSQEYGDPDPNVTEVIIPMASFQAEVKENKRSWLSAVIPNGKIYADAINARLGGEMYVTKYSTHTDGSVDSEEVARVVIEEISPVEGSFATTITISGFKTTVYPPPQGIELIPANYSQMVTIDAGRQVTSGDAALTKIKPGDQILLGSELFNTTALAIAVDPRGTQTIMKERI